MLSLMVAVAVVVFRRPAWLVTILVSVARARTPAGAHDGDAKEGGWSVAVDGGAQLWVGVPPLFPAFSATCLFVSFLFTFFLSHRVVRPAFGCSNGVASTTARWGGLGDWEKKVWRGATRGTGAVVLTQGSPDAAHPDRSLFLLLLLLALCHAVWVRPQCLP